MNYLFRLFTIFICLVVFLVQHSSAQWVQTNGPPGGSVKCLVRMGGYLIAGTEGNGVFRSTNDGMTWTRSDSGTEVRQLLSFVVKGNILFAGTARSGVFRSTDFGATWSSVRQGMSTASVTDLAVIDSTIVTATDYGMFCSKDDGDAWNPAGTGIAMPVHGFVNVGKQLYAETNSGLLATSDGTTWNTVKTGAMLFGYVSAMAGGSAAGATMFAYIDQRGVLCSTDNGTTWENAGTGLPQNDVSALAVFDHRVIAGTSHSGIYVSDNNGKQWNPANGGTPIGVVARFVVDGTTIYACTAAGVYVSTDRGTTWNPLNTGLCFTDIPGLAALGSNIFAGLFSGGGISRSSDGGASWNTVNTGFTNTEISALTAKESFLFAGTYGGGVFRSTDGGTHWSAVNEGLPVRRILAFMVSGSRLFLAADGGDAGRLIFSTTDNGSHWERAKTFFLAGAEISAFYQTGKNIIIATKDNGVFRSDDAGAHWNSSDSGLTDTDVRALAMAGPVIAAGTGNTDTASVALHPPETV